MKLLLLTLTALVLLPQVMPAFPAKKCRQQDGSCRRRCNANEEIKPGCKYRFGQVCCVRKKVQKKVVVHTVPPPTTIPEFFFDISIPFNDMVTVPHTHTPVFTPDRVTKNERPTQAVGTPVTLPPVP